VMENDNRRCVVGGASRERLLARLEERGVQLNESARTLLAHSCFELRAPESLEILRCSLAELGLPEGGTLPEILAAVRHRDLAPLPPDAGPYLRLAFEDQAQAPDSVLSAGRAPSGALHVLTEPLSADDEYPKGFYLRVVDGVTWLRGYRCDDEYVWPADSVFALQAAIVPPRGRRGPDHSRRPDRP
jgi:hypothetical protein